MQPIEFLKQWLQVLKNKYFYLAVILIAAFPYIYERLSIRIDMTHDVCLPYTIWITDINFNPNKQNYIMFMPKKDKYTAKAKYLFKMIACKPGQRLEVKGLNYYCDGKYISQAKKYDMSGSGKLNQFIYNGIIPQDNYFAIGTHPYAYDSKYFGFVNVRQIERGAYPVY
mgnify:CR=1 FL=1